MKIKKKWLIIIILLIICLLVYSCKGNHSTSGQETVTVKKGTVKEKIIAVGSIVPQHTISVKSNLSGIVGQLFHEEGDFVEQDALLLQVAPSATPQHIAEIHAEVKEHTAIVKQTESHQQRLEKLVKMALESPDNYSMAVKETATAKARLEMAQQKLALIQNGEATIAGKNIKTMISSPISGYILQRKVDVGDPVVPLTDMQEGTVLFVIANMQDLVFKGTVNEIDVAKITSGMKADVSIAALPGVKVSATLRKIDLQSNVSTTTTTTTTTNSPFNVGFNIELTDLQIPKNIKLRAGYSATAEITVRQADNTLVIPERVVIFKDNKVFANVSDKKGKKATLKEIKLGISDGMNVQVISGLKEGQILVDNPLATPV